MPQRITALTESQIIADIRTELRRRRLAAGQQSLLWEYQEFTTASGTLTYLPYGINSVALNGLVARQGTDYTVDYTTGALSYSGTFTSGDVLSVSYVTTGDLVAGSIAPDRGLAPVTYLTTAGTSGNGTTATINIPTTFAAGDLLLAAVAVNPPVMDANTIATPSGWTKVTSHTSSGLVIFSKTAAATESPVSVAVNADWITSCRSYRGTNATPTVTASTTTTAASTNNVTLPTLTATSSSTLVGWLSNSKSPGPAPAITGPASWLHTGGIASGNIYFFGGDETVAAGTTPTETATTGSYNSDTWAMSVLLVVG